MTEYTTQIEITQLKDIVRMVMSAAEADTLEQVLQRIADASRELLRTKYAALGVPDGRGGLRHFKVSGMREEDIAAIAHPPTGRGLIGVIMNERETVRLANMRKDTRSSGFPENHPEMSSMLGVPIQVGDQLFGMLYLSDRVDGRDFTLSDQWLTETLAGYAALAIAGTQLREQKNKLTLLEERQRIGMELHDGIIQSLYAVGMHLDLLRNNGSIRPDHIQEAIEGLNDVIEDIRDYIMDLKTLNQQQQSTRDAIFEIIARLYVPVSVTITVDAPELKPPFPRSDFESICYIVREALSNAIRHADASEIRVYCTVSERFMHMAIIDNGCGFDLQNRPGEKGLGLQNIKQRAKLHQGRVEIDTAPGAGTTVRITIPVP